MKKNINKNTKDTKDSSKDESLSSSRFNELVFTGITNILKKNPVNNDTQYMLERYIRNQFTEYFKDKENPSVLEINTGLINSKFNEYFFEKSKELSILIRKRKNFLNKQIKKMKI